MFWICSSENPQHSFQTCGLSILFFVKPSHHYALRNCSLATELTVTALTQNLSIEKRKEAALLFALRDSSQQPLIQDWTASFCNIWRKKKQNHEISVFSGAASSHRRTLLTPGCCFTASVLWNDSSPPGWTPSTDWDLLKCGVLYAVLSSKQMSLYVSHVSWSACFVVFCVLWCVRGSVWMCCESAAAYQPHVLGYFFLFFFPDDKTAFHLSCKQFRCIDVPSMHMPMCMW